VRSLIDALVMAAADLAGETVGDLSLDPLFLGGEQIGWAARDDAELA